MTDPSSRGTERTTAHLSNALDDRYFELERMHGDDGARLAAQSHTAAIEAIERTIAAEGVNCDFARLDGYLFTAPDTPEDLLERELAAAERAGLPDLAIVERAPLATFAPPRPALSPPGAVSSIEISQCLAGAIVPNGGKNFTATHAANFSGGSGARVVMTVSRKC